MNSIEYETTDGKIYKNTCGDIKELNLSHKRIVKIIKINGLTNLRKLDLGSNRIKQIEGLEHLTNLRTLYLHYNLIERIDGLQNLVNLETIDLTGNQIKQIEGFENLSNLYCLCLSYNQINKINGLNKLINLRTLEIPHNQITQIDGLDNLTNLQELRLYGNSITQIDGLENLANLRRLNLSDNWINDINGIEHLINLQQLDLRGMNIKVPITIMNLRNLSDLMIDAPMNPIIWRFLLRTKIKTNRTIYDDGQNVHDSQINKQISESLYRLMEDKMVMSDDQVVREIIDDPILTQTVKQQIVEYTKIDDVHSVLNVTFMEALRCVWQIIRSHEQSDEIKKVFNQEIDDSYCKCFTGRLSRLVNCLNGFDPRVSVKISDQQEIANLIIAIRQKYQKIEEQIDMARKELTERGYDKRTIDEWLVYLE
jgi:hypothetical protein